MGHPALYAEVMPANIVVYGHFLAAAHLAHPYHSPIEASRMIQALPESRSLEIKLILIVVLLSEYLMVPLEILEQDEAPPFIEIDQFLHIIKDEIQLSK